MNYKNLIGFVGLTLLSTPSWAEEPIDTDGPDYVESAEAVGKHHVQVETGVSVERTHHDDKNTRAITTPTLLRIGLSDVLEARIETDGQTWEKSYDERTTHKGQADTAIGLKWHVQDHDMSSGKPSIAFLTHFDLPTGTHGFEGKGVRPSWRMVSTWDFPKDRYIGVMPGVRYDTTPEGKRFVSGIMAVTAGQNWTESFRSYVETYADQIAHKKDGGVVWSYDFGSSYTVSNDWLVGARVAFPVNKNTPNRLLLLQVAGRF